MKTNNAHKTRYVPEPDDLDRQWHVIDAEGQILGKMATRIATILQGKHKPTYTPFLDHGDHVVVINADKVRLTGKKRTDKLYHFYSGYPNGLKEHTAEALLESHPTWVVELAVKRMMPKTKLGKKMFKKLRCYAASEDFDGHKHPHTAQKPVELAL